MVRMKSAMVHFSMMLTLRVSLEAIPEVQSKGRAISVRCHGSDPMMRTGFAETRLLRIVVTFGNCGHHTRFNKDVKPLTIGIRLGLNVSHID
jgi:hypothetical protein